MAILFLCLFLMAALAHVCGEALRSLTVRYMTKPLLMPLLAAYYGSAGETVHPFLILALTGGWLGDIFLMIPDPKKTRRYFRPGLVAFLLGHVFYIAVFFPYIQNAGELPAWGWIIALLYLATGAAGYRLVAPHAGRMKGAILAYIVIFVALGLSVVFPLTSVTAEGAVLVLAGAFIFMISDIVNAYNRFVHEIRNERIYTMGTYLAGQFLLVQGVLLF